MAKTSCALNVRSSATVKQCGSILGEQTKMNKPTKANFCTSIRSAITALQCSHKRALNICNSVVGDMIVHSKGEDKTGQFKAKTFKSPDKQNRLDVTLRPGSIQYRQSLTIEGLFIAYDDLQKMGEKLNPRHQITIQADSQFGKWLVEKCKSTPETDRAEKESEVAEVAS